ncbi:integrator complex subunit 9-like isoform X2 [Halichondria panicea]|uniref:integrator complex subunit 9-like isoform X2 n=1 Tax=Halichondria panicea TaxID=6063 RepID=UPI00312B467C
MEVASLGNKPWQPCYVVRLGDTTIMLDCALDTSVLLNFLPLPLVYSPKLSGLPQWRSRNADMSQDVPTDMFKENVGHVFIDSQPLVRLPQTGLVDFSTVDVLLISNCFSMLSLPFLTEKLGFKGRIYATEPTMHFGRQLMEELSYYFYRSPTNNTSTKWQDDRVWSALPEGQLKDASDYISWKELYSDEEIGKAIAKVTPVSYSQKIDLFGSLEATPISSGFCLGSCNWVLENDQIKVSYISSSSTFTTHPCSMERSKPLTSDVMILCGLTNAPVANPDSMLSELCGRMAVTLKGGGNVLIPCYPTGVVYDLLECLNAFLDTAGLSQVPVYFISPAAKSSLKHANIYAEWLCDAKKSKVFIPERPFPHSEFIKSGRLRHFPNIHGGLGSVYQTPCVVFTGHPSLRCGDAVHFMEAWGSSPKNCVIFTEPDFDYLHALAPYQPISMKAFYFPIDPRLNFFVANKLLKELAPQCLVTEETYLPSSAHSHKDNLCIQPEMPFYDLSRNKVVQIPIKGEFERIHISPELAGIIQPQELYPGVSVTTLSGMLSFKNNHHTLHPHPHPTNKTLWGQPSLEGIVKALRERGIMEVNVEEQHDKRVVTMLNGKATLHLTDKTTTIYNCQDDKLKDLLKEIIFSHILQF